MEKEFVISNCSQTDVSKLEKMDVEYWYDDPYSSSDVCVCVTREEYMDILKTLGRM